MSELRAGDTVQEQIEQLKEQHAGLREAMASELAGLAERLAELESGPGGDNAADRPNAQAAIEAVRLWCELPEDERKSITGWLRSVPSAPCRQATRSAVPPALEAVPDLVAAVQAAAVRPSELQALRALRREVQLHGTAAAVPCYPDSVVDALQTLDELDSDELDSEAPPPSDAGEEALRLRGQLAEAEALANFRYWALCDLADRDPCIKPTDEALLEVLRRRKLDWRATGPLFHELGEILGSGPTGEPLTALATRAVLHADPVLRLLDAYSATEIRQVVEGLRYWTTEHPDHSALRGAAEHLDAVADLANREAP